MKPRILPLLAILCGIASAPLAAQNGAPTARIPTYTVIDLGVLPDYQQSRGLGLNNEGAVVGYSDKFVQRDFLVYLQTAFLYTDGAMIDIGASEWASTAEAINSSGVVVGATDVLFSPLGADRAFLWHDGVLQDLGLLPGTSGSWATDINDAGAVVGLSASNRYYFFRWTASEGMVDLNIPSSSISLRPTIALNNANQIVGWYAVGFNPVFHAFVWNDGVLTELFGPNGEQALAYDINDSGEIVGWAGGRALIWRNGIVEYLALSGDQTGFPSTLNSYAQAVGGSGSLSDEVAVLWHGRERYDLNVLVPPGTPWKLRKALGINDAGELTGYGSTTIQGSRALLLKPIDSDVDDDGSVTLADLAAFQSCLLGPSTSTPSECEPLDLDRDGDVDFVDYRSLELAFEATAGP